MSNRRSFLSYAVGMLAAISATAQTATMQKGKAIVCPSYSLKCPLGHDTCATIDAPLVIGNGNRNYPDVGQVFEKMVVQCDVCGILFIKTS
jgi:hypothetical protein